MRISRVVEGGGSHNNECAGDEYVTTMRFF